MLMLSALVISPESEAPAPQPVDWASARLLPLALPAPAMEQDAQRTPPPWTAALLGCLYAALSAALPRLNRDANGRVLNAKRYENSFYQLFRQEIAGG